MPVTQGSRQRRRPRASSADPRAEDDEHKGFNKPHWQTSHVSQSEEILRQGSSDATVLAGPQQQKDWGKRAGSLCVSKAKL